MQNSSTHVDGSPYLDRANFRRPCSIVSCPFQPAYNVLTLRRSDGALQGIPTCARHLRDVVDRALLRHAQIRVRPIEVD